MLTGAADLRGMRVLVVEDEYFIAEDIAHNLRDRGVDVLGPCGNIEQAVRLLATGDRIDAAVLDVNLHDGMVYTLADALRRRGVPFLFATGYDRRNIPQEYSGVPVCSKPLDWSALAASIAGLMREAPDRRA